MSESVETLSENLPKAVENEGSNVTNILATPSKEPLPTNSTDNLEAEFGSTATFDRTAEVSAKIESSQQIFSEKRLTENVEQTPTSTEADKSATEESLISVGLESAIQVPSEKEEITLKVLKSTNVSQSSEDGLEAVDKPAQEDKVILKISKCKNDTESGEEGLAEAAVVSTEIVSETVENQNAGITLSKVAEIKEQEPSTDKDNTILASSPTVSTDEGVDVNYAEHMTYESDGSAIYEDPKTKYRYKWSSTENNWIPCDSNNTEGTANGTNPYENDHYKWCTKTQKWIPKVQAQTTETEHYKWDADRKEWIPKVVVASNDIKAKSDPSNVTYDIDEDGQRIYTDKDGTVFFWDTTKNAWFPKIDDDFMAHYQMNYGFIDNTSASEEEKRRKAEEEEKLKELELQRMTEEARAGAEAMARGDIDGATNTGSGVKRKAQEPPKWFDINPDQNTKVYVSNLPLDITLDEFAELMGKCGMIMRDQQTQKFKLKLYAEPDGQLKGDGLCDYIKVESVDLALNILDEYNLRGNKIQVQRAQFQMRGEYNPALKPKRKKKDKEKLQKMKEKLFDWRPEKMRGERSKNEKVVIIKNLFDPSIFEKEVQLILDYQNDLREECSKCGTVRKVVIYDRHPEGVAQINMADPEEADVVIQMMQGRYFGQRQLSAEHWDGKTKYKVVESEAEVQKRLTNWDQYLTQEENERKLEESKSEVALEKADLCEASECTSKAQEPLNDALGATHVKVKEKQEENVQ